MTYNPDFARLAGRIYDLDEKVYELLGSSMGRVFYGSREKCVREMLLLMSERKNAHELRTYLALIGNMARSLKGRDEYHDIMKEYNAILGQLLSMPTGFGEGDIFDKKLARLSELDPKKRFSDEDHLVICISRTYGCSGSTIGFKLADALKINYYDVEILEKEEQSEREEEKLDRSQKTVSDFIRYHGLPRQDARFFMQSRKLSELARKESFVVMGRCADVVLTNSHIPHVSIFITAPMKQRIKHIQEVNPGLTEKKARKILEGEDRKHRKYYKYYTGRIWGDVAGYDMCLNSAVYGIDGSVKMIEKILPEGFECVRRVRAKESQPGA